MRTNDYCFVDQDDNIGDVSDDKEYEDVFGSSLRRHEIVACSRKRAAWQLIERYREERRLQRQITEVFDSP